MANNDQAPQPPQQPTPSVIPELFNTKAQQANAVLKTIDKLLGDSSPLIVNPDNGRRKQVFADGEITEKVDNAQSLSDLAISYKPFSDFVNNNGHQWLGDIIEDFYPAKNGAGKNIVVQRYQNGVIWWDGQNEPCCLAWHDWHAIAWSGNTGAGIPNQRAFSTFWKDLEKLILSFVRLTLFVIFGIVVILVIVFACRR